VQKHYLAKVHGQFPEGEIKVDQPIFKRDSNQGLQIVDPKGKPATTLFNRISTDGTTSIVKCTPITGRTHQIRVHLQWLGHAIINDPIYNANRQNYDESFQIVYDDEGDVIENSDALNMNELQLHICLHALEYCSLDENQPWKFQTELPFWAKEEDNVEI
jgi:tRNA pseudouridine synthase 8/2,5-diamino-6-(5-phospho-D-ribitylamino)-pyrimidin-4(3H)-one deaminase